MLKIELVYVDSDGGIFNRSMELVEGSTVADGINQSGINQVHHESQGLPVGIYSRQVSLDTVLNNGDRIEIYRLLTRDPKEKRRQLARTRK